MRHPIRSLLLIAAAVLGSAAAPANAETVAESVATLGAQAEAAEHVALVDFVSAAELEDGLWEARFSVRESLKGGLGTGDPVRVVLRDLGHGFPWRRSGEHLVFLRAGPDSYRPVAGSFSIRPLPEEGPEREFAAIVRRHLAAFDGQGVLIDAAGLRVHLIALLADGDAGTVWSAARDLVRLRALHAGMTAAQRIQVLDAYRAHPADGQGKAALGAALAVARPEGAGEALVETLADPRLRSLRGSVSAALAALADPRSVRLVLAQIKAAEPVALESLVHGLGALGDPAAAPALRGLLLHELPAVRVQAAHSLGKLHRAGRDRARRARREDDPRGEPEAVEIGGREELVALLATARTINERKAATWALAQIDDENAYAALRRLEREHPNADVRRFAERYRERPRLSLILR